MQSQAMNSRATNLANGTHTVTDHDGTVHTIELEVRDSNGDRAVPSAGTATVKVRTPKGFDYTAPADNQADLTSEDGWLLELSGMHVEAFEITLASLEAGHTLSYSINSSYGGA